MNRTEHIFIDIKLRPLTGSVVVIMHVGGPAKFLKSPRKLNLP